MSFLRKKPVGWGTLFCLLSIATLSEIALAQGENPNQPSKSGFHPFRSLSKKLSKIKTKFKKSETGLTTGDGKKLLETDLQAEEKESFRQVVAAYHFESTLRPAYRSDVQGDESRYNYYRVLGDGDCGLHALGITRKEMVDTFVEAIQKQNPIIAEHISLLIAVDGSHPKAATGEEITQEDLIAYVKGVMGTSDFYLHGETLPIIADLFGWSATVWTKTGGKETRIKPIQTGQTPKEQAKREVHILHSGNHFDLLVEQKNLGDRALAVIHEKLWTQKFLEMQSQETLSSQKTIQDSIRLGWE